MNVASLENCKTLWELSGWDDTERIKVLDNPEGIWYRDNPGLPKNTRGHLLVRNVPLYDLGYLLRKLPEGVRLWRNKTNPIKRSNYKGEWSIGLYASSGYGQSSIAKGQQADTPEDCTALMAIELFKSGVLKKK